jgi:hypothetical protein
LIIPSLRRDFQQRAIGRFRTLGVPARSITVQAIASIEKWLDPLKAALKEHRNALRELEIRFKDPPSRTYQYQLEADEHVLRFNVCTNGQQL